MDKPEQLFCYSCKNSLGWATDPAFIFKCKCGLVLRRGAGDNTVKAEAEFIDLVNQLNNVEDAMRMELSNLKESISGGRGMPPAMVAPTDSTAYLPISVIFLFFLVSSFFSPGKIPDLTNA